MRTARYGVSVRKNLDLIREMRSKKYKCPRCKRLSIRRLSSGLWACKKCGLKVADNAYSLSVSNIG